MKGSKPRLLQHTTGLRTALFTVIFLRSSERQAGHSHQIRQRSKPSDWRDVAPHFLSINTGGRETSAGSCDRKIPGSGWSETEAHHVSHRWTECPIGARFFRPDLSGVKCKKPRDLSKPGLKGCAGVKFSNSAPFGTFHAVWPSEKPICFAA